MTVVVSCSCRNTFNLKDEYAGQLVECPVCGASVQAGRPRPSSRFSPVSDADPAFDRDLFLLRQKIAISEKYAVTDEAGRPILFVERPVHFFRNLLAVFGALAAAFVVSITSFGLADTLGTKTVAGGLFQFLGVVGWMGTFVVLTVLLQKKRHVTFYRDDSRREPLIEVLQDAKFQPIVHTFTLRDARGSVLATLEKNVLFDFFRRRWLVRGPRGEVVLVAREDSIILSLLRRVLGPLYGLLRTNFLYERPNGDVIGEFKRNFTILDRYVLDLAADAGRTLDRRIAIALGVMLDTGERR